MDYQETVTYLKSYKKKHERMIYLENMITGIRTVHYGEQIGSKKSINDYLTEISWLSNEMAEIENMIDNIPDNNCRLVLGYKYLQFKTFEEIAEIMDYSERHIRRIYKNAINMLLNYASF